MTGKFNILFAYKILFCRVKIRILGRNFKISKKEFREDVKVWWNLSNKIFISKPINNISILIEIPTEKIPDLLFLFNLTTYTNFEDTKIWSWVVK